MVVSFFHAMGYLTKLKRGLGLAFDAYFLHDFYIKYFLFNTLSMDKVPMSKCPTFFLFNI